MQVNDQYNASIEPEAEHPIASRPEQIYHQKKTPKKLILLVIIVVTIVAGTVFAISQLKSKKPTPAVGSNSPSTIVNKPKLSDLADTAETKVYDNGPLGLSLTYPSTWTTTETTDSGVRVESPIFNYQNLDGDAVSGNFRIYIRKGARAIDSKYIGRGVAIDNSTKITYAKPAIGQRADTLLSNFGLDTADNFAFFFVAGNFQLKTGDTLGPNYGKEPETFIISGGYSGTALKDDMATNQVPVGYIASSNAYKQALNIIKSLQLH